MEGPAFVRTRPLDPLPPPVADAGAIGWLRQNLFPASQHALTIVCALLIVWMVPPLVKFLVIDAVWNGAGRADCLPTPGPSRSRRLLGLRHDRIDFFIYGFYPIEERWRVDVFFVLLAFGIAWMAWLTRRAAISAWSISSSSCRSLR